MARKPAPGTRDRILETAARLFYEHGVHAVGQQQVVDECGCGKNLLYREFPSKDELVVAYLEQRRLEWAATVAPRDRRRSPATPPASSSPSSAPPPTTSPRRGSGAVPSRTSTPSFPTRTTRRTGSRSPTTTRCWSGCGRLPLRVARVDPKTLADRMLLIIDGVYANGAILGSASTAAAVAFAEEVVRAAMPASAATRIEQI